MLLYTMSYYIHLFIHSFVHSLVHSGYFYGASSSQLLLRGAPDTSQMLCRSFTPKRHMQGTTSERLAQGAYVAYRAGFKPATLRTKGAESTNEPPRPTIHIACRIHYFTLL